MLYTLSTYNSVMIFKCDTPCESLYEENLYEETIIIVCVYLIFLLFVLLYEQVEIKKREVESLKTILYTLAFASF